MGLAALPPICQQLLLAKICQVVPGLFGSNDPLPLKLRVTSPVVFQLAPVSVVFRTMPAEPPLIVPARAAALLIVTLAEPLFWIVAVEVALVIDELASVTGPLKLSSRVLAPTASTPVPAPAVALAPLPICSVPALIVVAPV